ncbi:MAG: DUF4349 domain-containing protein [Pseudomonadota bacterium]
MSINVNRRGHIISRTTLLAATLMLLAACGGGGGTGASDAEFSPAPAPSVAFEETQASDLAFGGERKRLQAAPTPTPSPTDGPIEAPEGEEQYIAYSHNLGLRLPLEAVEPVMQGHVAACREAGTGTCIVINSNLNNQSEEYASAYLSIRAQPEWIETFVEGVDQTAEDAGGEVSQRSSSAEDLTRTILDTDARLKAQTTLKRRLEDLLATRDGDLSDFLQIERELARVTGDIESITSNLKALRLRVSMSELTVSYETKRTVVPGGRRNPLARAFGDFFYNLSDALASVITFFALALPWLLVIGVLLFIWLRAIWPWVRRRRNKAPTQS